MYREHDIKINDKALLEIKLQVLHCSFMPLCTSEDVCPIVIVGYMVKRRSAEAEYHFFEELMLDYSTSSINVTDRKLQILNHGFFTKPSRAEISTVCVRLYHY